MATFKDLLEQLKRLSDEELDQPVLLIPENSDDALYGSDLKEYYCETDVKACVSKSGIYFCGSDFYLEKLSKKEIAEIKEQDIKKGLQLNEEDYEPEQIHPAGKAYLLYKLTSNNIKL